MNGLTPQQSLYISEILSLGEFKEYEISNITPLAVVYLTEERPRILSELLTLVNFV